jgi:small GTP-binding protein
MCYHPWKRQSVIGIGIGIWSPNGSAGTVFLPRRQRIHHYGHEAWSKMCSPIPENQRQEYIAQEGDAVVKAVLVGDSGCGKSCLMERFACGAFREIMNTEPGQIVDFRTTLVRACENIAKLEVWDAPDQQRFIDITTMNMPSVHAIFCCYDAGFVNCGPVRAISDLTRWINEIERHASENVEIYVIGLKADLCQRNCQRKWRQKCRRYLRRRRSLRGAQLRCHRRAAKGRRYPFGYAAAAQYVAMHT